MKTSFRHKLTFFAALFIAVTLGLFAWLTAQHLRGEQLEGLDKDITEQVRHAFDAVDAEGTNRVDFSDRHVVEDLFAQARWNFYIEITRAGTLVYRSANCAGASLPTCVKPPGQCYKGYFRGKKLRLGLFEHGDLALRLGASMEDVQEVSEDLLISYAVTLPLTLLALAFGAWRFSVYALQPVRRMAQAAQKINADRLHERLPLPEGDDEMRQLAVVFNQMFDRLEPSFRQAVRFTADASHELKTPLTIIRGELETALRSGEVAARQEPFFLGLLDETNRLTSIVESLLLLARADAGELQLHREPVDLSGLLGDLCEDAEVLGANQNLVIQSEIEPGLWLRADASLLRQMLLNPLHNAIRYNVPGGWVRLVAHTDRSGCRISFSNSGPGIPPEHAAKVFDRFFRGDPARAGDGGHGLGLSIAREIARAHNGDMALAASTPGCTWFVVSLPTAAN